MADIDRIGNLPDELLFHILSFLSTEDVFATSLVSKRFRPLWLSVTNLDFDEYRFTQPGNRSPSSFINFVSAAILACGIHQPIKTLRLRGQNPTCTNHVETWLTAATVRHVENLEIDCYDRLLYLDFPCSSIFSSKTLVVLKLVSTTCKDFSTVELPSLKALHLYSVFFLKAQHLMELLNGCPNLENLEAHQIMFDFNDPSFKGKGKLKTLSKLVRADLSFMTMRILGIYNIDEFVRKFWDDADIPIFPNLIDFQLIVGGFVKMESVLYLLNHCPQLQTFVLENLYCAANQAWPNTPVVPECFSSQLQTCIITNFAGTKSEMTFAKFVMQNSTLLCTMAIFSYPDPYLSYKQKAKMRIKLESCPKSSATCELLFK